MVFGRLFYRKPNPEEFARSLIEEINTPGLLNAASLDKLERDLRDNIIFNNFYKADNEQLYLKENANLKKSIIKVIKHERKTREKSTRQKKRKASKRQRKGIKQKSTRRKRSKQSRRR